MHTTVMRFVLRGAPLPGMDSVQLPIDKRRKVWALLGDSSPASGEVSQRPRHLDAVTSEVDVKDVVGVLDRLRAGAFRPSRGADRRRALSRQ